MGCGWFFDTIKGSGPGKVLGKVFGIVGLSFEEFLLLLWKKLQVAGA